MAFHSLTHAHEGVPKHHQHRKVSRFFVFPEHHLKVFLSSEHGVTVTIPPLHIRRSIDLSLGVPGVPPPGLLLNAIADHGSLEPACSCTAASGGPSMRSSLTHEMRAVYGVTPDDIVLTDGCSVAFVAVTMAIADSSDRVVLLVPW